MGPAAGTSETAQKISVVVPVYNSEASIVELARIVEQVLSETAWELILVDDGSATPTWECIRQLSRHDNIKGVRLARNSGQHVALLAGVSVTSGDIIVTIDDDLQFDFHDVRRLLDVLSRKPSVDLVYGWSPSAAGSGWRRLASRGFRAVVARMLGMPEFVHVSPFRAFRATLLRSFPAEVSAGALLDAHLAWSTQRLDWVEVVHRERAHGKTGYSLRKLIRLAIDVVTSYSVRPLRTVALLGLSTAAFGLAVLSFVIVRYLAGSAAPNGLPFIASIIALFAGAQMLSLGIIGEYLGRIHVKVMGRPGYVIAESTR